MNLKRKKSKTKQKSGRLSLGRVLISYIVACVFHNVTEPRMSPAQKASSPWLLGLSAPASPAVPF